MFDSAFRSDPKTGLLSRSIIFAIAAGLPARMWVLTPGCPNKLAAVFSKVRIGERVRGRTPRCGAKSLKQCSQFRNVFGGDSLEFQSNSRDRLLMCHNAVNANLPLRHQKMKVN
jgi:hypothetical protein